MKYLLRKKDEEKAVCVVCKKTFIRKKGRNTKTCSDKCARRLRNSSIKKKGVE